MASFGEELKRERELRDISLKEISEATKISIRFLEGLEQNNFDVLPGGVFNRGFIRAYARFIGVDGEEMVNAYLHEVALREARQTQSGKGPMRPAASTGAGSTEAAPSTRAETRTHQRIESRTHSRDARAEIPPEKRFSPRATREANEGRTSMALWALVVIAFLVGVGVITMSFLGDRHVDASSEGHAQALRARLGKKAAGPNAAPVESPGSQEPTTSAPAEPVAASSTDISSQPSDTPVGPPAPEPPQGNGAPVANEHHLKLRVVETTRVTIGCGGKLALDLELWPGQSRALNCAEPVVLGASNAGAVEYSLDDGPPVLLGEVGQQVEGLTVAPAPTPAQPTQESKDSHAGR